MVGFTFSGDLAGVNFASLVGPSGPELQIKTWMLAHPEISSYLKQKASFCFSSL